MEIGTIVEVGHAALEQRSQQAGDLPGRVRVEQLPGTIDSALDLGGRGLSHAAGL
jgi:sorbitol-specific phosphotransferase system component IIA